MRLWKILMALPLAFAWAFAAPAGMTTFKGVSVDYGNASTNWVGGDLLLTYASAVSDTLSLGGCVQARVLLVGGGGSGSSGGGSSQKTGYAGKGGTVVEESAVLLDGNCTIAVGAGGDSVKGGSSRTAGKTGSKTTIFSEIAGIVVFEAAGGEGGGGNAPGDASVTSDITGTQMTYGKNGGTGANSKASSGAGGAGVAIVRLTGPGPLITGRIRVGAYEVDVQNASRTNWVDGELVVTYLNTDAFVAKSFTLPQPTTGRFLAVGGGGAGGQNKAYNASYGLPGGGGAGGMVVNDGQAFSAAKYTVTVGAGGVAERKEPTADAVIGANGGDTTVWGTDMSVTAVGGGGGGARGNGNSGGSGGGGSCSYANKQVSKKSGGTSTQENGFGNEGGDGNNQNFGGGGGGAGGAGGATSGSSSGAGGPGRTCNITGEPIEYARGGAGGAARLYNYYTINADGTITYVNDVKSDGKKYFLYEAKDGRPGLDGRGDGGGGSGYYDSSESPTFAGSGGSGVVIVRIPPYSISVEDALKEAFEGQPAAVSGSRSLSRGMCRGRSGYPTTSAQ